MSTTDSHNAGDIRFPAKEWRNYFVTAKAPGTRLGFTASWSGENDPKRPQARLSRPYASALWLSKADVRLLSTAPETTGGFAGATLYDPAGIEVEPYFDYRETRASVLALGEAEAQRRANMQDWTYNDAKRHRISPLFTSKSAHLAGWIKNHTKEQETAA